MIEYLKGTVVARRPTSCVVEVSGVGYEVHTPMSTFERVPEEGATFRFFTHHHVREDAELLFGFATTEERQVFRTLVAVSGVGPKLGLAALSAYRPDELRRCVTAGDVASLTRIPGVGRKTAERMIVELRDRMVLQDDVSGTPVTTATASTTMRSDAFLALESLGLSRNAAERQVASALKKHPDVNTTEDLIRLALRDN